MRVIRHLRRLQRPLARTVLTLGNFDGVHRGHQEIIRRAVAEARALGGQTVALTFEPHPTAVLAPDRAPPIVQPLHDRLATLRDLGVDVTVLQRFTRRFAALTPEAFVRDFLVPHLEILHVVVGYNVNFGRDRAGSIATLRTLGGAIGFAVDEVGPIEAAGAQVSSTRLREVIQRGDMHAAAGLLARPYALRGRVVTGERRGRTLGFPTANLHPRRNVLLPADGVYAVRAVLDGQRHPAVLNLGLRPTFGERRRTIEAHLCDWSGDLYGRWLTVEFVERLRGEAAFTGLDALRAAIAADVARARAVLAAAPDAPRAGR